MTDLMIGPYISTGLDSPLYEGGGGSADHSLVPWELPVSINDHAYMIEFEKSRITSLQVRRVSADDSVEPGEQTLSAAGVWPRAQDNWFLGAGQKFLDNRFAFESVYVHSGEYPSVRTRFWHSLGINPWGEGQLALHLNYAPIATTSLRMIAIVCEDVLYVSDGPNLFFTVMNPPGPSPAYSIVTATNTQDIVSMTTDGARVWFACGSDGVFETDKGTTSSTPAATPAALVAPQGVLAFSAGAGTVDATNLPPGATTWSITAVDAFGNETDATTVTATVAATPVNLNWNPQQAATGFNVYRGTVIVTPTPIAEPSFVDDGSVAGVTQSPPGSNDTGVTVYPATFVAYAKGHLLGSTGRDLNEILADGSLSFIFQHVSPDFTFTCASECPSAILVGGYAGDVSFIGAIQPDATTNGATLAPPTWATSLPKGEKINDLAYSAGSMLLATSSGIRSGTRPDANGTFDVNPSITDPGEVLCLAPFEQYEYFGWANYDSATSYAPERQIMSGLGRADLSQFSTEGIPAYATDVMGPTGESVAVTNVVILSGVPFFVVNISAESWAIYGPTGFQGVVPPGGGMSGASGPTGPIGPMYVESGWLEPGWVRYGTLENKIIVEVDFQHEPLPDGASVDYQVVREDLALPSFIGSNGVAGSTTVDTPLSLGLQVGDRFLPIITLNSTPDQSESPTFLSHITKAMVTTKRQDEVLLAIIFKEDVESLGDANKRVYFDLFNEWVYLKGLEHSGQVVTLTLMGYVRDAFIDQVMLEPLDVTNQREFFSGLLTVKLITLN